MGHTFQKSSDFVFSKGQQPASRGNAKGMEAPPKTMSRPLASQAVAAASKALALGSAPGERGERGAAARLAAQCRVGLVLGRARARLGLKQFAAAARPPEPTPVLVLARYICLF